ncbi:hypothetical protein FRX31_013479, partial [Thalictrum thalictroides]
FIPNYSPTSERKRKCYLEQDTREKSKAKRTPESEPTKKRERKSDNGSKGTITEVDPLNEKEAALGAKEEKVGSIIEDGASKEEDGTSEKESEKTSAKKQGITESASAEDSKVGNIESASAALGAKEEKGGGIIDGEASKEEDGNAEPAEELPMHVDAVNKEAESKRKNAAETTGDVLAGGSKE